MQQIIDEKRFIEAIFSSENAILELLKESKIGVEKIRTFFYIRVKSYFYRSKNIN